MAFYGDSDAQETQEWQEAFDSVLQHMGTERAAFLLEKLYQQAIAKHVPIQRLNTPYLNTISVEEQPAMPGDQDMERRIRALIRWNALAMVLRANKTGDDLGGHLPVSHLLQPYMMLVLTISSVQMITLAAT
jgi:pyruvate dehydrogenase E1 component